MAHLISRLLRQAFYLFACLALYCGTAYADCTAQDGNTFRQCEKYAQQGHAQAQAILGTMYHYGIGVASNPGQAAYWYRKAAEQGNSDAQLGLGLAYDKGLGVNKDPAQAAYWFRKAAEQGDMQAQYLLGIDYSNGKGVERDPSQAAYWYRKAAEQGYAPAQNNLGAYYSKGEGVEKDPSQAAYWFRKAAEQGDATGQNNLGAYYSKGEGVEKDPSQAAYWFRKAAEQGNAVGQNNLGAKYLHGEGVTKDIDQGVYWQSKAAVQGNPTAIKTLGTGFVSGEGYPLNIERGIYWLNKGAALNQPGAIAALGRLYGAGLGVEKDMRKARAYLERAAALWQTDGTFCPKNDDDTTNDDYKYNPTCMNYLRHLALVWRQGLGGPVETEKSDRLIVFLEREAKGMGMAWPDKNGKTPTDDVERNRWASATLENFDAENCRTSARHSETISFKDKPGVKPSRYFDAALYIQKGVEFGPEDIKAWQETSDILQQCGVKLRQMRIYSEETCQKDQFRKSIGSAVPIEYANYGGFPTTSQGKLSIKLPNGPKGREPRDIAHEFGHLLSASVDHPADFEPSIMQYLELGTDRFTPAQCEAMRRSPLLAHWPALPTKRTDTSSSMPVAWKELRPKERIKQLQAQNSPSALFYDLRAYFPGRYMYFDQFMVGKSKFFSNLIVAMVAQKYGMRPNQVLRMLEVAHDWPAEAGWPTEKTSFDLSGNPDLFWLPDWQNVSLNEELEQRRVSYFRKMALAELDKPKITADQSTIDSDKTWCNADSLKLDYRRNLRPGDAFTIDPELSSRMGQFSRDMEVWLHGGDLFYVVLTPKGREVALITPNALGFWDGESLDEVRKNTWYNRDWEKPARNPVDEIKSNVVPTSTLRIGNFGGLTPATLPGAKTVTPFEVWQTIVAGYGSSKRAQKPLILAAMDDSPSLPTARNFYFAAKGTGFDDEAQQQLKAKMQELGAKKDQPIVVYCHHESCWLSYNLGLRLVALGYTNVQWLRSGWKGWLQTGLPMWTVESTPSP